MYQDTQDDFYQDTKNKKKEKRKPSNYSQEQDECKIKGQ